MRKSEINHGDSFSCRIQGRAVTGVINGIEDSDRIYLCNNIKDGARITDRMGKKYSWVVMVRRGILDFAMANVTEFRITRRASKPAPKVAAPKRATVKAHDKEPTDSLLDVQIRDTLAALKKLKAAKLAAKKTVSKEVPGIYHSWKISKRNTVKGSLAEYQFGCGAVALTVEDMSTWARIMRIINTRRLVEACPDYITQSLDVVDRLKRIEKVG